MLRQAVLNTAALALLLGAFTTAGIVFDGTPVEQFKNDAAVVALSVVALTAILVAWSAAPWWLRTVQSLGLLFALVLLSWATRGIHGLW